MIDLIDLKKTTATAKLNCGKRSHVVTGSVARKLWENKSTIQVKPKQSLTDMLQSLKEKQKQRNNMFVVKWHDIVGVDEEIENKYEISNTGIVRRKPYMLKSGKMSKGYDMKPVVDRSGYWKVNFRLHDENGKTKKVITKYIHRMVAMAFIPTDNLKLQVHHKDDNKRNNKVDNLAWVTAKQNNNLGNRNKNIYDTKMNKQVKITYADGKVEYANSYAKAGEPFGLSFAQVRSQIFGWRKVIEDVQFELVDKKVEKVG